MSFLASWLKWRSGSLRSHSQPVAYSPGSTGISQFFIRAVHVGTMQLLPRFGTARSSEFFPAWRNLSIGNAEGRQSRRSAPLRAERRLLFSLEKIFLHPHFLVARRRRPCILQKRTRKNSRNAGHEIRLGGQRYKLSSISVPAHFPSRAIPTSIKKTAKLTLWPLVAATFFMVSGGTYGTEEIIHGAGYGRGILILVFLPVFWSLPTAFMIGELSSSLPQEGGYYAWVRRGLGNFWGFQEAWLSLAASIFDMAIYPTLFVFYLKQEAPWFGVGNHGVLAGLFVIAACAALNVAGIRVVGITSLWLFFLLSLPFALVVVMSPF